MKPLKCFSFFVFIVLYGCSPNYYLPTKQNVMIFEEKGDAIVTANLGSSNTVGVEAGYAFTDNLGVYSSFNSFSISKYRTEDDCLIKDFIWDNELVYFKKFKNNLYTGLNLGYGIGKLNNNNSYYDLSLQRQFIQPSVGITIFDNFQMALSMRATRLEYDISLLQPYSNQYDLDMAANYFMFEDIIHNKNFYFLEPALNFGWAFEFFSVKFQYTFLKEIMGTNHFYLSGSCSASIGLNLNKLFFNPYDKTKKLKWRL